MEPDNDYKEVSVSIKDAYEDFILIKKRSHFSNLSPDQKKKSQLSLKIYKKIIKRFLIIFVYDLFFLNYPIYFFLGGKIKKVRTGGVFPGSDYVGNKHYVPKSLGFMWYKRPFKKYNSFFLSKQRGKTSSLVKIINEWLKSNDLDMLPSLKESYTAFFKGELK